MLLMFLSMSTIGEDFPDRIVTSNGDIIECDITLVNSESIYYYYLHRDIRRPGQIGLDNVSDFTWTDHSLLELDDDNPFREVEEQTKKWGYGVKFVQQFNMPIKHTIVAFNVNKGNHSIYIGPHYTHIAEKRITGDTDISYAQHTYGVNFGYNVIIKTRNENFDVFMQLDFSLYEADSWFMDGPYSEVQSERSLVVENCISTGIRYNFSEKLSILGGYGFGSANGFFFEFEDVIPQIYLGLQYQIK